MRIKKKTKNLLLRVLSQLISFVKSIGVSVSIDHFYQIPVELPERLPPVIFNKPVSYHFF
jgi:hypothetical protein